MLMVELENQKNQKKLRKDEENLSEKHIRESNAAWHSCSVSSEQPLPPLYKEAANWMLKRITIKGCWNAEADFFKEGTLEVLI